MVKVPGYDPKTINVSFSGTAITGFSEGTFVKVAQTSEQFESVVGAHGEVSVACKHDARGTVEITLKSTSPSLGLLARHARAGTVASLWIHHNGGVTGGSVARIKKVPDYEWSDKISNVTVVFEVFDLVRSSRNPNGVY